MLAEAERLSSPQVRRSDASISLFRQSLALAQKLRNANQESRAWFGLGEALLHLHQQDEAESAFRRSLELARQVQALEFQDRALHLLAVTDHERGNLDEANEWMSQHLALGDHYPPARLRALNSQAATQRKRGHIHEAISTARHALTELNRARAQAIEYTPVLNFQIPYNLGKALIDAGNYAEGMKLLQQAGVEADKTGNIAGQWHVEQDMGEINLMQGDLESSANCYRRALAIARTLDSRDPEAESLRGMGLVAESNGQFETAAHYYLESLRLFESSAVYPELPETLVALSRTSWNAGKYSEATAPLERCFRESKRMNHQQGLALAHLERARQMESTDRFEDALREYNVALEILESSGWELLVPAAWKGIGEVSGRMGRRDDALAAYEWAAEAVDRVHASIPSLQQRISFVSTTHEIYRQWVDALLQKGANEQALLVVERERARNLADALREAPAAGNLAATTRQRSFTELRTALQPAELYVAYLTRRDSVVVFLVNHDGIRVVRSATPDLSTRIESFNRGLSRSDSRQTLLAGRMLSEALIAPLALDSPTRLIISANGELAALAFAALPQKGDRPLIEKVDVTYAASLSELASLRRRKQINPPRDLMAVAPLARLPATLREVREVAGFMAGPSDQLVAATATTAALRANPLRDYKVLHFATHATLDPRFPSLSAIEMADQPLSVRDIFGLNLDGQLVFLGACNTAAGRSSAAEGLQSLSRAFSHAGARSVVGTLWRVEDRQAMRISADVYRELGQGKTVSEALRGAQLAQIGKLPYQNAAMWAPWVSAGDAGSHLIAPPHDEEEHRALGAAAIVLLLALSSFAIVRR